MACCSIVMLAVSSGGMTLEPGGAAASQSISAIGAGVPMASRSAATMARGCGRDPDRFRHGLHREPPFGGEHRFGRVNRLPVTIEWLSDNGSCYIAGDTRSFARDIGLEPRTTPIESPQSNGMAEAFVRTIKRDYVRVSPRPNAESVMRQLPLGSPTTTRFTRTRLSDIVHPVSSSQLTQDPDRVRSFGGYNTHWLLHLCEL